MGKSVWVTDGVNVKYFPRSSSMPTPTQRSYPYLLRTSKVISPSTATAVHWVEELVPHDPRSSSEEFRAAIRAEVSGLFDKGVFTVVLKYKVPKDHPWELCPWGPLRGS